MMASWIAWTAISLLSGHYQGATRSRTMGQCSPPQSFQAMMDWEASIWTSLLGPRRKIRFISLNGSIRDGRDDGVRASRECRLNLINNKHAM